MKGLLRGLTKTAGRPHKLRENVSGDGSRIGLLGMRARVRALIDYIL